VTAKVIEVVGSSQLGLFSARLFYRGKLIPSYIDTPLESTGEAAKKVKIGNQSFDIPRSKDGDCEIF